VRTTERAAAALGISVVSAKLYAFGLGAAIAAVGGMLMFSRTTSIVFGTISNSTSIMLVALAVIGGIGYLTGPLIGATLFAGASGTQIGDSIFSAGVTRWLQALSGGILILLILQEPDGVAKSQLQQVRWVAQRLGRRLSRPRRQAALEPAGRIEPERPRMLEVRDITVRYGGAVANAGVSLALEPGQIVGLIGPNGAGKATLVDAMATRDGPRGRHRAERASARRVRGGPRRDGVDFAFGTVRQLFENALATALADVRVEMLSGAAALAGPLFAAVPSDSAATGPETSFATLHGLYWLAASCALRKPTLIAVDDLHWADEQSLRWLAYLARRLEGLPMLVIAATRPLEQVQTPAALAELVAAHSQP
jgi:hypothetical protein